MTAHQKQLNYSTHLSKYYKMIRIKITDLKNRLNKQMT